MATTSSSSSSSINEKKLTDVAQFLLDGGFLLTALEFHQELIEEGNELQLLKKKFDSQPGTEISSSKPETKSNVNDSGFISGNVSVSQRDALLKENDELKEKLSQVQADLRAAKDNVNNLNHMLMKQGAKQMLIPKFNDTSRDTAEQIEINALNFLVRKYLLENGYKLTVISLEEEVSQDFTDWSLINTNIPEPPSLIGLYRDYIKNSIVVKNNSNQGGASSNVSDKNNNLGKSISQTQSQGQETRNLKLDGGLNSKRARMAFSAITTKTSEDVNLTPEEISNHARISQQLQKIIALDMDKDEHALVKISGESLPLIVPGVILKKREELLPLIICVIHRHPDKKIRYLLTQTLFNLIKKPNEYERKMIVDAFVALAKIIGEERTETELLPQCSDEISNKHPERRILVADCCCALANYVKPDFRFSWILSSLQHLIGDKHPTVREAASKNLGLLISLFTTEDKYSTVEDLAFQLLFDPEFDVRVSTQKTVFPFLADWSDSIGVFCTRFMTRFLDMINNITTKQSPTPNVNASGSLQTANAINEIDSQRLKLLFSTMSSLLPRLRESILLSAPFNSNTIKDAVISSTLTTQQDKLLQLAFEKALLENTISNTNWPAYQWLIDNFLLRITTMMSKVNILSGPSHSQVVQGFVDVFAKLLTSLGKDFTTQIIDLLFKTHFQKNTKEDQPKKVQLLPLYLGIIAIVDEPSFLSYLKELVVNISLQENGWSREQVPLLRESIRLICQNSATPTPSSSSSASDKNAINVSQSNSAPSRIPRRNQSPQILSVLWELLTHPANHVRVHVVTLFNALINVVSADEVAKKVMPALVTLSSDPDKSVQYATLKAFGTVAMTVEDTSILDRISVQMNSFIEEDFHLTRTHVAKQFAMIIPSAPSKFRDTFVLPKLFGLVQKNHRHQNVNEKTQLAHLLFECFRAFHGCLLDEDGVRDYILPGLKILDIDIVDPSYRSLITAMINEMDSRLNEDKQHTTNTTPVKSNNTGSFQNSYGHSGNTSTATGSSTGATGTGSSISGTTANLFGMGMEKLKSWKYPQQ